MIEISLLQLKLWDFRPENPHYYMTQEGYLRMEAFQPAEDLASAFLVFEYILIEDKTVLTPCGSGNGRYWAVYFEDVFLGVGRTKRQRSVRRPSSLMMPSS